MTTGRTNRPTPTHEVMMDHDPMNSFEQYAAAFEVGYDTEDWGVVDALMTDDIVWSVGGLPEPVGGVNLGRRAAIAAINRSVRAWDRRFDVRTLGPVDPVAIPGGIYMAWQVTFSREGLPAFVAHGEEWDLFRDGKLAVHHERTANSEEIYEFLAVHGAGLLPPT